MGFPRFDSLTNLTLAIPAGSGRIIGRERDVEQVCSLLTGTYGRLVTLTGLGGVGKTRLGIEIARKMQDRFTGGVWWMDLAALSHADQVMAALAGYLGVGAEDEGDILTSIIGGLRDRDMVVVLDNIEQVRDLAAPLAAILARCPDLHILATGRIALNIRSEQQYPLEPLSVSTPGAVQDRDNPFAPAVELFVDRARAANPRFQVTRDNIDQVVAICRQLDGLPLAIELVAAQVRVLDLEDVLAGLAGSDLLNVHGACDLPPRQQTMAQTLVWSDGLLSDRQRHLFYRLSVFTGGFSLEAAAAVTESPANISRDVFDAMNDLGDLVRWSLITRVEGVPAGPRFRMLELTRAYAFGRLEIVGDADAARRQHARHYLHLAQQVPEIDGSGGVAWLNQVAMEHDNLRAALAWALETGEVTLAAHLAVSLARFWYVRGFLHEGRMWLERVLSSLGCGPSDERVDVLGALCSLAAAQGDGREESRLASKALRLARALDDEPRIAVALHRCGNAARGQGDLAGASQRFEEARTLLQKLGDRPGSAAAINNLGIVAADQGNLYRSRQLHEEALSIFRDVGSQRGMAITLCNLGQRMTTVDEVQSALRSFREAMILFQSIGDMSGIAWGMHALANLTAETGELALSSRLYGAAEAHRRAIGWRFSSHELKEYEQEICVLRDQMTEQQFQKAWAAGQDLTAEQALADVSALDAGPNLTAGSLPALLTDREVDVLRLVADGLTNAGIADNLSLSPHTVDTHLRRIYRKLEVRTRSAALRFAVEHDLV